MAVLTAGFLLLPPVTAPASATTSGPRGTSGTTGAAKSKPTGARAAGSPVSAENVLHAGVADAPEFRGDYAALARLISNRHRGRAYLLNHENAVIAAEWTLRGVPTEAAPLGTPPRPPGMSSNRRIATELGATGGWRPTGDSYHDFETALRRLPTGTRAVLHLVRIQPGNARAAEYVTVEHRGGDVRYLDATVGGWADLRHTVPLEFLVVSRPPGPLTGPAPGPA